MARVITLSILHDSKSWARACIREKAGKKRFLSSCDVVTECFMVSPIMPLSLPILLRPLIKVTPTQHATCLFFFLLHQSVVFFVSRRWSARRAGQHLDILWIYGSIVASEKEHMSGCPAAHKAPWTGSLFLRLHPHKLQVFLCFETSFMSLDLRLSAIYTVRHAPLM